MLVYWRVPSICYLELKMSDQINKERAADGAADAIAVTVIIAIVVTAMYVWLSGMPS